ncbi:MAG: hypothetical protein IPJ19_15705 [Planctomycetes bacterium]|nr:hypothetical protein [Planctomycetota bacterium]
MLPRSVCLVLAWTISALPAFAAGHVLTVGGSNPDFTDIQPAIQAAALGDVVLVRPGSYSGFLMSGKSVSVIADPPGSVTINGTVLVQFEDASQPAVVLSGLHIIAQLGIPLSCAAVGAPIRCVEIEGTAVGLGLPGANIYNCSDVAMTRCIFRGGTNPNPQYAGGDGLDVGSNSRLALSDCSLHAGAGAIGAYLGTTPLPPVAGPHGVHVWNGATLFASGTQFRGGAGGDGAAAQCSAGLAAQDGAAGGAGVFVTPTSHATLLDCGIAGGTGGAGGTPDATCGAPGGMHAAAGVAIDGTVQLPAGLARSLECASVLRESNTLSLEVRGTPGDLVLLAQSPYGGWSDPAGLGPLLVGQPARRTALGTIPASGVLHADLPISELGAGVDARTLELQAICRDAGGQAWRTGVQALVLLDSSF